MAKEFSKSFYNSWKWRRCRTSYMKEVFCLCEKCRKSIGMSGIVHHIQELTPDNINDNEISLGFDNLMYLCIECHNKEHGAPIIREGLAFDSSGNLIKVKG
jgi:hypothetical protein